MAHAGARQSNVTRRMMGAFAAAVCAASLASLAPAAQADEAFYRGRSIDLIVGYPVGGANVNYAPGISKQHIRNHIFNIDKNQNNYV